MDARMCMCFKLYAHTYKELLFYFEEKVAKSYIEKSLLFDCIDIRVSCVYLYVDVCMFGKVITCYIAFVTQSNA